MEVFAGQTIRDYQLLERIGSGGNGLIYKARQTSVDRDVAVKIILPDHLGESEFVERFKREAHIIAQLEHPYIVPIHDFWQDNTGLYLVMRYLRGGSLRDVIKQQGALSLPLVVRIVEQIGDALATAHNAGIIHRDIKPDNILLDHRGYAYLTDFGIARNLQVDVDITDPHNLIGTPAYASPDQIEGAEVTCRTDIYSLGIVLYELLTGEHPFPSSVLGIMLSNHLTKPVPPLQYKRPALPAALDPVIQKATSKNAHERYPDVPALVVAFREAAESKISPTVTAQSSAQDTEKQPAASTLEGRYRADLLQNIHTFWIKGVLDSSVYGSMLVNLKMEYASDAVKPPRNILLRRPLPQTFSDTASILDVFDTFNGKLLILGDPGSGKTTRLLELARALLVRANNDDAHPIPVILNLSSWSERRRPVSEWLVRELADKYQVPAKFARSWVDEDKLTLLLDGLDEVTPQHRDACVEAINDYRQEHSLVDVVVCSRLEDYKMLTYQLSLNGAMLVKPLDDTQIDEYLANLGVQTQALRKALKQDKHLQDMSRSPLMLNIMAQVYEDSLNLDLHKLPASQRGNALRSRLFKAYVEHVTAGKTDQAAPAAHRPYPRDEIFRYLSVIAWQLTGTSQTIFNIGQLSSVWLPTDRQVLLYRTLAIFTNATMSNLSLFAPLLLVLVFRTDIDWQYVLAFLALTQTLFMVLYFFLPFHTLPTRAAKKTTLSKRLMKLVSASWLGAIVGGLAGFVLAQFSTRINTQHLASDQTILITLAGIIAGAAFQILSTQAGLDYFAHYVLRFVMFITRQIPLKLTAFLDHAVSLGLLRKVGSGYIFMHRYLLDYFADLYAR